MSKGSVYLPFWFCVLLLLLPSEVFSQDKPTLVRDDPWVEIRQVSSRLSRPDRRDDVLNEFFSPHSEEQRWEILLDAVAGWGTYDHGIRLVPSAARLRMKNVFIEGVKAGYLKDFSILRDVIKNEDDPRMFYLMASHADFVSEASGETFIPEMFRMLDSSGLAKNEFRRTGPGEPPVETSVSVYSYWSIVRQLKRAESSFVPPDRGVDHKKGVRILKEWLIANWPGCEKFTMAQGGGVLKSTEALERGRRERTKGRGESDEVTESDEDLSFPWWGILLIILALIYLIISWVLWRKHASRN